MIGEVVYLVLIGEERAKRHDDARHHVVMCGTRRLLAHLGSPRGKQAVARHREEDSRLAVLKHEQDSGRDTTAPNDTTQPAVCSPATSSALRAGLMP
jgi:hypothetical protein